MHTMEIIRTHPHVKGDANDALIRCIDECFDCAQDGPRTALTCSDQSDVTTGRMQKER